MKGNYELHEQPIVSGRSNIHDFGPPPQSSGPMRRNDARKQAVQETKKRRNNQEDNSSSGPHANPQDEYRAILWKGLNYARNAAKYIRDARAKEYSDFTHLGPPDFQGLVSGHASIAQSINFNPPLTNQTQPYLWQAHHMIPGEAFYTEDSSGQTVFHSQENFDILLQAPYDIDHGHNMIMLPSVGWAVPVHALLQHPNNHNGYTKDVLLALKRIASQIDTLRGQKKSHEGIVANVFENLKKAEEQLWKALLRESRKAVRSAAEGKLYAGSWTRWQTRGGRVYDTWPALW